MYEKFGKLIMWSYPMPSTRRLYRSNPRDFGKMFASMYFWLIPIAVGEVVFFRWAIKKFLGKEETVEETIKENLTNMTVRDKTEAAINRIDFGKGKGRQYADNGLKLITEDVKVQYFDRSNDDAPTEGIVESVKGEQIMLTSGHVIYTSDIIEVL